jgi:hypothetical protein
MASPGHAAQNEKSVRPAQTPASRVNRPRLASLGRRHFAAWDAESDQGESKGPFDIGQVWLKLVSLVRMSSTSPPAESAEAQEVAI